MRMSENAIVLSIRPEYAEKIFQGNKHVELRRICPKHIKRGTLVLIYVSSPIQSLAGAFKVDHVIKRPLQELWELVQNKAGITRQEFDAYFQGVSSGIGIFFTETWKLIHPIKLQELQQEMAGFLPPQGFRYITKREIDSSQLADFVEDAEKIMKKISLCTQ